MIHPNLAAIYRQKVADLHGALQRDDSRAEAADILRDLIEEITFTPEDDELHIDLRAESSPGFCGWRGQQKARL